MNEEEMKEREEKISQICALIQASLQLDNRPGLQAIALLKMLAKYIASSDNPEKQIIISLLGMMDYTQMFIKRDVNMKEIQRLWENDFD